MLRKLAATAALVLALPLGSTQAAERDNYLCYGTKSSFNAAAHTQQSLANDYDTSDYNPVKAQDLCLPVSKDGDAIGDADTALTSYQIKLITGQPKPASSTDGLMTSPTDLGLRTVKPAYLMLPANTCLPPASCGGLAAPDPDAEDVDNYACYSAKTVQLCAGNSPSNRNGICGKESDCGGTADVTTYCQYPKKFPKDLTASLTDAITTSKTFDLKKPSHLCTTTGLEGVAAKHPHARMVCYQAKGAQGSAPAVTKQGVEIFDQFGLRELDTKKEHELCVAACAPLTVFPNQTAPYIAKINSLQIGVDGNPGSGLDVDANSLTCSPMGSCSGGIDNAFGSPGVPALVNPTIASALTDGSITLLLELEGLNLSGGPTTVNVRTASLDPDNSACAFQSASCNYLISNTCDVDGSISATLTGTSLTGGGPGYDLTLHIPLGTSSVPITVHSLKVVATVTSSGGVVTGVSGILGGAFIKQELVDTIAGIPEIAAYAPIVNALLPVDIDLDHDTVAESTSLGLVFGAIGGSVTGIQP